MSGTPDPAALIRAFGLREPWDYELLRAVIDAYLRAAPDGARQPTARSRAWRPRRSTGGSCAPAFAATDPRCGRRPAE